jgi:hypothetical protein
MTIRKHSVAVWDHFRATMPSMRIRASSSPRKQTNASLPIRKLFGVSTPFPFGIDPAIHSRNLEGHSLKGGPHPDFSRQIRAGRAIWRGSTAARIAGLKGDRGVIPKITGNRRSMSPWIVGKVPAEGIAVTYQHREKGV